MRGIIFERQARSRRERTWFLSIFAQDAVMGWSAEGAWLLRFLRIFFLCHVGLLKYFALSSNGPFLFWSPFHRLFVGWIEANFRRHSKGFFSNSCHQKSGHVVLYPFLEIAQRFFLSVVVSNEFSFDLTPSKSVDRTWTWHFVILISVNRTPHEDVSIVPDKQKIVSFLDKMKIEDHLYHYPWLNFLTKMK